MNDEPDNVVPFRGKAKEPTKDENKEWWLKYNQPHEAARHGVLLHVPAQETMQVELAATFYLGAHGLWKRFNEGHMSYDYEYVYQGNGRIMRPWGYCGTSLLFKDWQDKEAQTAKALVGFRPGMRVRFQDKAGRVKEGIVSNVGTKNVMVVVEHEGTYRVPPTGIEPVKR